MSCQSLIQFAFVEPPDQAPCNPHFRFVFVEPPDQAPFNPYFRFVFVEPPDQAPCNPYFRFVFVEPPDQAPFNPYFRFVFVEPPDQAPCNPYFRFVFDRTYLSEDKSVPSSPSKSIRFLGVAGSTGETSAYLDGNTSVSVWGMSHITFAPNFQFLARFRLREDYPYEDAFYTLIADGPCEGLPQQYSVTVNPIRREIHSFIKLKNKEELDLLLPDVVSWRVFINCVSDLTIF